MVDVEAVQKMRLVALNILGHNRKAAWEFRDKMDLPDRFDEVVFDLIVKGFSDEVIAERWQAMLSSTGI